MSHVPGRGGRVNNGVYPTPTRGSCGSGGVHTRAAAASQGQEGHGEASTMAQGDQNDALDRFEEIYNSLIGLTNICTDFAATQSVLPNLHHMFKVVERNHARHVFHVPYEVAHREEQIRIKREVVARRRQEEEEEEERANGISRFEYQQQSQPQNGFQMREPVSLVMPENHQGQGPHTPHPHPGQARGELLRYFQGEEPVSLVMPQNENHQVQGPPTSHPQPGQAHGFPLDEPVSLVVPQYPGQRSRTPEHPQFGSGFQREPPLAFSTPQGQPQQLRSNASAEEGMELNIDGIIYRGQSRSNWRPWTSNSSS